MIGESFSTDSKIGVRANTTPTCESYTVLSDYTNNTDLIANAGNVFTADRDNQYVVYESVDYTDENGNEATGYVLKLAADHVLEKTEAKAETCTEDGNSEYWTCTVCDKLFSDEDGITEIEASETIPAKGHDWGEWTVIRDATETETGLKEHTCSICHTTETAEIPVIGHEHEWAEV